MSRIAKNSINISDNVTCKYENGNFYAKGKLGEMTLSVDDLFKVEIKDKEIFVSACNFIGLLSESKSSWNKFKQSKSKISEEEIKQKITERNKARKNKDYKAADEIRNELLDKGVLIEDKDDKTLWKFK